MNNQFSQRVSDIITYSKEEANRLRNRYIGPEHLLLGMLRDGGGKAIEILMKLDIDLKQVKKRIESFLRDAEDDTLLPDADVPLSPMAAKILKMCILEARILKSATADAEHVLLAILKDGDNLAATVLEENRVNYQAVFEQLTMQSTNPNAGMGFPEEEEEDEDEDDEKASEELRSRKKAALEEKKKREEQEMTEQLRAADQKTAEEEKQDEFEIPDLEEEETEQVSFNTVDLQNLVRGEETEEIPEAVEETEIVEEAAAEETAEEVTEETEETESAEPETVEEIEEFEETIEEPEEEPEPEPSEPIELAMPVYTAEELLQKAHAAGDDPKVIEDPATGITILDYSDIL